MKHDGADATVHAAMQADAMLDKGDLEGKRVWLRIMKAIEEMQRTEPRPTRRRRCPGPQL